jgi:hypothetical protein
LLSGDNITLLPTIKLRSVWVGYGIIMSGGSRRSFDGTDFMARYKTT